MPNGVEAQPGPGDQPPHAPSQLDRDMVKWTRAVAWFTGLLFVANAVGLFFIWQQWRVANASQVDTREQLRAVVTYEGATFVALPDKDGKVVAWDAIANFHNFGATRTASFQGWVSIKYFDGAVPNNIDVNKPYLQVEIGNVVIGPNSPYQIGAAVPAEDVQKAIDKKGVILFWGFGQYSDIFDPPNIKPIHFCLLITPLVPLQRQEGQGGQGDQRHIAFQPAPYRPDCNTSK